MTSLKCHDTELQMYADDIVVYTHAKTADLAAAKDHTFVLLTLRALFRRPIACDLRSMVQVHLGNAPTFN